MLGAVLAFSALSGLALTALLRSMDALPGPYLAVSGRRGRGRGGGRADRRGPVARARAGRPRHRRAAVRRARQPGLGQRLRARSCCPASGASRASCSRPARAARRMRDVAYFDGHALLVPALVLAAWALLGAALILVGRWAPKPPRRAAGPPSREWRCRHDPRTAEWHSFAHRRTSATRPQAGPRGGGQRAVPRGRRPGTWPVLDPLPAHGLGPRPTPRRRPGSPAPR